MDKYHGIVFGGGDKLVSEPISGIFRQPAPYKLRTIARDAGYNIKAIDYGQEFSSDEITQVLENLVTKDTLFIGVSCQHFVPNSPNLSKIYNAMFNFRAKSEHNPQLAVGGFKIILARNLWMEWDWVFSGYVDHDFIQWLHYLSGKPNDFKWKSMLMNHNGKEVNYKHVLGNDNPKNFTKEITDNMEIEWLEEDQIQSYEALPVEISRGCRFVCDYCEYPLLRSKQKEFDGIRASLSRQLATNKEKWGVTNYWFDDFTYNSHQGKLTLTDNIIKDIGFKIKFSTFIRPELIVAYPEQQQQLVEQGLNGVAFGMETGSEPARHSISKGGNLSKINEAAAYMNKISNGQTSFLYLMMLGIPDQTIKDMENDRKYVQEAEHIDNFEFNSFWMSENNGGDFTVNESLISKDPDKYGYYKNPKSSEEDFLKYGVSATGHLNWKNKHTSFIEVTKMEHDWRIEDWWFQKVGGVASMYFRGMGYDVDTNIGTLVSEIDLEFYSGKTVERVKKYIKSVVNEKLG